MSRRATPIECSESDLAELEQLAKDNSNVRLAKRAAMVIECAKGTMIKDVAERFSEREGTVRKWKNRYSEFGISGLTNRPRGKSMDGYGLPFMEKLQQTVKSPPPEGQKVWTGPLLANALDVPVHVIRRYLKKANIRLPNSRRKDDPDEADIDVAEESKSDISDTHEPTESARIDSIIDAGIATESKENSELTNKKLGIEFVVKLTQGAEVIGERVVSLQEAMPELDSFNISVLKKFRDDFDIVERIVSQGRDAATREIIDLLYDSISKKKLADDPSMMLSDREVESELGRFNIPIDKCLDSQLSPEERIKSYTQEGYMLYLCSKCGGSYRIAAEILNMFQHRYRKDLVISRTLADHVCKEGLRLHQCKLSMADDILTMVGVNPKTLTLNKTNDLAEYIQLPPSEPTLDSSVLYAEEISAFNEGREEWAQIKDLELVRKVETCPADTLFIALDEIGVNHQAEQRAVNGKEKKKKTARVENTVIYLSLGTYKYVITATSMAEGFKLLMAFLFRNKLLNGRAVVFFSDGAKNISSSIEKFLTFYPYFLFLDWYHLSKRIKELVSMALSGKIEEKRIIIDNIKKRLWPGNVDDAIEYIKSFDSGTIKNKAKYNELISYLERKRSFIYCYALRSRLEILNASSPVEKANDLVVGQRQKHNGMSWSYNGSSSLAEISATIRDSEISSWIRERKVAFEFPKAS